MDLLHEILEAVAMPNYKVRVRFDTGERGVFDCSSYLGHPYWKQLADPAFFNLVRVEYGTLAWPNGIDIAPEDVWEKTVRDPDSSGGSNVFYDETLSVAGAGAEYDPPPRAVGAPFDVRAAGAVGDGIANDTAAIQRAIDAAGAAGGGEVLLPAGIYRSGSLFLRSGVDFHLAEGAVLKASPDPADYNAPDVAPQNWASPLAGDNTSGGHLLLCVGQARVTLRGPGRVDGNAPAFLRLPDGSHPPSKRDIPWRPGQMVWFAECRDVAIRDIELADAPYWSCFLYGCEGVTVERARIHTIRNPHTYNGDGLDIDCCRRVRVSGCDISTADDSLTLRADPERLLSPGDCADIIVEDCSLSSDCNAIRLGVGNGTIRDAALRRIRIANTRYAVNAVGAWSRPDRGVDIRRVSFEDFDIDALGFCKFYYKFATDGIFEDIRFRHVRGTVREPSIFDDTPERPFRNLVFDDVDIAGETSPRVARAYDRDGGTPFPQS